MGVLFSLRRALIQVATDATPVTPDPERHTEPHAAYEGASASRSHRNAGSTLRSAKKRTISTRSGRHGEQCLARQGAVVRGIEASIVGDSTVVSDLYTEDVRVSTPALSLESAVELAVEIEDRESAFTDIDIEITALDVGGERACAEWICRFTHSGPLDVNDDAIEPTGTRVTMRGVTVADFDGEKICAFRQYWDEVALLEQLGLLPVEAWGPSEAPDQ